MNGEESAAALTALAPQAPPCFEGRRSWVIWLLAADEAHRKRPTGGPLVTRDGKVAFNFQITFCDDCTVQHRSAMVKANRCHPEHLRSLATETVS